MKLLLTMRGAVPLVLRLENQHNDYEGCHGKPFFLGNQAWICLIFSNKEYLFNEVQASASSIYFQTFEINICFTSGKIKSLIEVLFQHTHFLPINLDVCVCVCVCAYFKLLSSRYIICLF
jgi:hypothetical protein